MRRVAKKIVMNTNRVDVDDTEIQEPVKYEYIMHCQCGSARQLKFTYSTLKKKYQKYFDEIFRNWEKEFVEVQHFIRLFPFFWVHPKFI